MRARFPLKLLFVETISCWRKSAECRADFFSLFLSTLLQRLIWGGPPSLGWKAILSLKTFLGKDEKGFFFTEAPKGQLVSARAPGKSLKTFFTIYLTRAYWVYVLLSLSNIFFSSLYSESWSWKIDHHRWTSHWSLRTFWADKNFHWRELWLWEWRHTWWDHSKIATKHNLWMPAVKMIFCQNCNET